MCLIHATNLVNIMEKYQKRMIAEFKELGIKIQKLQKWMDNEKNLESLSSEMTSAMFTQLNAMYAYSSALFARLELMGLADEVSEKLPHLEIGEVIETDRGEKFRCVGYDNDEPIMERVYE